VTCVTQCQNLGRARCGPLSVDVELVALKIFHRYPVVVDALLGHDAGDRSPAVRQPPCLGVDSLFAGLDRNRPPAAGVDVEEAS
jgi:hypothetical protein